MGQTQTSIRWASLSMLSNGCEAEHYKRIKQNQTSKLECSFGYKSSVRHPYKTRLQVYAVFNLLLKQEEAASRIISIWFPLQPFTDAENMFKRSLNGNIAINSFLGSIFKPFLILQVDAIKNIFLEWVFWILHNKFV